MPRSAGPEPGAHAYLDVVDISKAFRGTTVMSGMDFRVARGELVSLLGPSGCGKTTLLRIIAGLTSADAGDVVLDGRAITKVPAHKRNISVVFQSYALFPHLTVAENLAFGLRARGMAKAQTGPQVADALALVRMSDFAERPVAALSGGQQQRVAVARALIVDPVLLLLDEPFSALDRKLRETMQVELKSLLRDRGMTAVFVTHDQEEAMGVSDRIAVMNAGRIEQFATPSDLYARPASAFVMDFVGLSSRLSGKVKVSEAGALRIETPYGEVRAKGALAPGAKVVVGVRPELIRREAGENTVRVALADAMILGAKTHLYGASTGDDRLLCELPGIQSGLERGQQVTFGWSVDDTLVYEVER
ncbi:heme ABC exporter ATP-binding protein CcmA [Roseobacter sinensis]|uniref:Heme ABC exporter ATP-binding protein CcmA n=1 Tax=Roseobacter sinensis TaxID=2931391 RepID=A0ABT3BIQ2_9RHOB|nr:heme ABC exporter ATP-binding protein CcmA [Roseobacter sp. WL0113]MCV3273448.1 heme ABC exporter ATP-binding protein CcmA [Roseobacter sp. WL0113]